MEHRYFSAVHGRAVQRFGRPTYIGAVKGKDGFVWSEDEVVAIPLEEYEANVASYREAVRCGDLRARTEMDHMTYLASMSDVGAAFAEVVEITAVVDSGGGAGPQPEQPKARKRSS